MSKHTPKYELGKRPFDVSLTDRSSYDVYTLLPIRDRLTDIAYVPAEDMKRAQYILNCVNTHQSLVDALEFMLRMCDAEPATHVYKAHIEQACEALRQAKEREL